MKTYYIFITILFLSLTSCTSSKWASADSYSDDLYFNAYDKPLTVSNDYIPVFEDKEMKKDNRKEVNSMHSGYIKENPNYSMEQVTSDFSNIQTNYTQLLTNDSISNVDTVMYYNDEIGYWVDGFDGSVMDLDYATRIIRFHGPFVGVPYWSPLYTDVLYSNSWDWNIYVDGNYAYAFPTYTNPFYWNSGFNMGFGYGRMSFGMSYGWGYPGYGWGYPSYGWGYPSYGWGYPGYGWGYPGYGWGYPGYGWGYPGYGPGYPIHPGYPSSDNYYYGSRITNPTSGRMNPVDEYVNNPRSATATTLKSSPSSRTTRSVTADNNMVITKGTNTYTRVARSNQAQPEGDKKSVSNTNNNTRNSSNGSVSIRTTRKSYSSYSKSASTKRPTFNRPTTSRSSSSITNSNSSSNSRSRTIYSAPRRSSSTSSRTTQTTNKYSSKSTYRSGSSKSSTYSPSRSSSKSSSKSSYTSTPSSSSRSSSGSSYSSGSSTRSSGGGSSGGSSRSTRGSR